MRTLIWFRRDLRIHDNRALEFAANSSRELVGLYVLSPAQWRQHAEADCKVGFWLEGLKSLSASLAEKNIPLRIASVDRYSAVPKTVAEIANRCLCGRVVFNQEYEVNELRRDEQTELLLHEQGLEVCRFHDRVILAPGSVLTQKGEPYTVFTPFRKRWEASLSPGDLRESAPPSRQRPLDIEPSPIPERVGDFVDPEWRATLWPASEQEAERRRLQAKTQVTERYKLDRDFPGLDGTSQLSPYLAAGMISPRQCLNGALNSCDGDLSKANEHVECWISELTWREFYIHILASFPRVCRNRAFRMETENVPWRSYGAEFTSWAEGRTGIPLVDAGMRQLNSTGWMHNRVRMVTAMFLTKNLLIDWRIGERYFMEHLIDGDLPSNNGGWQWSASTGTDAAPYFRIFNPFRQAERFDPHGKYIRRYCPELASIPDAALHDPAKLKLAIGANSDYPQPIVDVSASREFAIRTFATVSGKA